METYAITFGPTLRGRIALPTSKSLSARALIIAALAGDAEVRGLSDCDDTRALSHALSARPDVVDVGPAGTAMRFATAYFATQPGTRLLTGTPRMLRRPIRALVDALRQLGADVAYEGQEGYPPLRVAGRTLRGGEVELPADVSSQYVTALLLIAPSLCDGLRLRLLGQVASRPYIDMTLALMRHFGAEAAWLDASTLHVAPRPYRRGVAYAVEADWSAASYWYELVALSPDAEARIELPGLVAHSLQGDRQAAALFEPLGVHTDFGPAGAVLTRCAPQRGPLEADFAACPDLAQAYVATCALLGRAFRATGLDSLRIKETDRIAALQTELGRLGARLDVVGNVISSDGSEAPLGAPAQPLATYDDHRMAMCLAPAALLTGRVSVAEPSVVTKSYPAFWDDLRSVGAHVAAR